MEPTFGERLTSWLEFLGIRPAELARRVLGPDGKPVSRTAVHGWMHGGSSPGVDRLPPICDALGVSVAEFFARMPTLEADVADEEEPLGPHPKTGDTTRVEWCPRCGSRMGAHHDPCPACGYRKEAA
jgi:transcriptional regulator with XRE-family HTH domain